MNFSINPSGPNALEGEVALAMHSKNSTISNSSENSIGFQTLAFNAIIDISITPSSEVIVLMDDRIPSNCMIYSTVAYSSGLVGKNNAGTTVVSGDTINNNLTLKIEAVNNDVPPNSVILNDSLPYPNMVSGEYNPQNLTNPFILSLSDPYEHLRLVFGWTGTENLASLEGVVYVRMVIMQADPNNTARDGYPTGGVARGPVPGSTLLPSV